MTLLRSVLAGAATGSRTFSGITACASSRPGPSKLDALLHRGRIPRAVRRGALVEVVMDKLPIAPDRKAAEGLTSRVVCAALAGAVVAARSGEPGVRGAAAGLAGCLPVALAGARLRGVAAQRLGGDLPGALAEDALSYTLAFAAVRG